MSFGATYRFRLWISLIMVLSLGCSFIFSPIWADQPAERVVNADLIRVGISDDAMTEQEYPLSRISSSGSFQVIDSATGQTVLNGSAGQVVTVTVDNRGFWVQHQGRNIAGTPLKGPLRFTPKTGQLKVLNITRKGKVPSYRGELEVTRGYSSPKKLSVVNILPLLDYLKAVVPNELPAHYGLEAVKAQSIAARNYALRPREKAWPQFDICDSQYCQAYYGSQTETPATDRALEETEGLVALYDGELILALYSSAHGGFGEDYANVFSDPGTNQFPATPLPYLSGGPDVPIPGLSDLSNELAARKFWTSDQFNSFDVNSSLYRWERTWKNGEVERVLNEGLLEVSKDSFTKPFVSPLFKPGDRIGTLKRIHVLQRGKSGKAMTVKIEGTQGSWTIQKEFVIRKVFKQNGRMLPSANVVFSHLTDQQGRLVALRTHGGGFGHGVGMSQLGASWMSKHGHKFPEIIQHYYKGVSIGTIPLHVGGSDGVKQPIQTSFYVNEHRPEARLIVQTEDPTVPVKVKLNDRWLELTPRQDKSFSVSVESYLKSGSRNTMTLYPGETNQSIRVWVELYPAKEAPIQMASPVSRSDEPSNALMAFVRPVLVLLNPWEALKPWVHPASAWDSLCNLFPAG